MSANRMLHKDELNELQKRSKEFRRAHRAIARDMGRGKLFCATCRRAEPLDVVKVEKYLREGWPKCCGVTMSFQPGPPRFAGLKVVE